ncbi:MAG: hypothetical protein FJY34_06540 [Betaproteobacteria bacterium]|nr:hypothetical protein [Betaproteobacteria bacterium]
MKTQRWPRLALMAAALFPLTLTACVVAPSAPTPHAYYDRVIVAPPPPRVEVVRVAPYPGYIWIGGYWSWHGHSHQHHWVPGRWEAPRHGHRWVPHRWEQHKGHWREHPGRWERH